MQKRLEYPLPLPPPETSNDTLSAAILNFQMSQTDSPCPGEEEWLKARKVKNVMPRL